MPRIAVTSFSAELVNPELVRCVVEMMPGLLYQAAEALDAASRLTQDLAPAEVKQSLGVLARGLEAMRRDCSELRQLHIRSVSELGLFAQAQNRALLEEGIRARVLLHLLNKEVAADDASWSPWGAQWSEEFGATGKMALEALVQERPRPGRPRRPDRRAAPLDPIHARGHQTPECGRRGESQATNIVNSGGV